MEGTRRWTPDDGVTRVLIVTAHPDDVDFGSAGTVASFTRAGIEVVYCVVTDGEAGGLDRSVPRAEVAALRRDEQRAAAARVGVSDVRFLGYPDGRVTCSLDLRRDISRVVRQVRPQRLITQSPERQWDRIYASHPDHLAAGEAAVCAVYPDARNPFAHPGLLDEEGLEPHTVGELWLMAAQRGDIVVETTSTVEDKVAALLCHKSQIADEAHLADMVRQWGAATADRAGLPEGAFAESFQVVSTR
ncbi:MAG TPA: PIG-L deacetylase family protein [Acidimicrobiales bacterium]|nr:PIG-L deacetylase family protein [Acidimicrobiales bacterium]